MIALDALEQLDARAFQLIAADAGRHRRADRIEIAVEKPVGKVAHRQPRGVDMLEQHRAVPHHRHRGMQRHGSCRAAPRAARAPPRDRPAWKTAARRAPASGRRRPRGGPDICRDRPRLLPRQQRARPRRHRRGPRAPRSRARRDRAGRDLDRNAGRLQHRAPHRALGREHQRFAAASQSDIMRTSRRLPAPVGAAAPSPPPRSPRSSGASRR